MSEVCLCGQTEPTHGWPCSHGGCHFVDVNAFAALDRWLEAAEAVRATCGNLEAFDALIAEQRKRARRPVRSRRALSL